MTRPVINGIAPFSIVRNAAAAVAFYRDKLGFDVIPERRPRPGLMNESGNSIDPRRNPPHGLTDLCYLFRIRLTCAGDGSLRGEMKYGTGPI
jgi:hypothetical protein